MTRWILPALLGLALAGCQIIEPRYPAGERERIEVIERGTERPSEPEPAERAKRPATTGRVARQVAFPVEEYVALEKRGNAVRDMLVLQGAGANQISVVAYGEEKPACDQQGESCWSQNRRAELVYGSR